MDSTKIKKSPETSLEYESFVLVFSIGFSKLGMHARGPVSVQD